MLIYSKNVKSDVLKSYNILRNTMFNSNELSNQAQTGQLVMALARLP